MIVRNKIDKKELVAPFTKAVIDVERGMVAMGCELHIDCAEELIQDGSRGAALWGFNIYPDGKLDFISLVNIRPADGNRTMELKDEKVRECITAAVQLLLAI